MTYTQTSIFDVLQAQQSRDAGIEAAVNHADAVAADWSLRAKHLAEIYVRSEDAGFTFQVEEIRQWAYENKLITAPPSERAWACITKHLLKKGLIVFYGFAPVSNKKANRAISNVWQIK